MSAIFLVVYIIVIVLGFILIRLLYKSNIDMYLTKKVLKHYGYNTDAPIIGKYINKKIEKEVKSTRIKYCIMYWVFCIILGAILFGIVILLESTVMQQYSTGALIDILFKDPEEDEEDEKYPWEFGTDDESEDGINGHYETISERDAFLDVVYKEWEYYATNGIIGGRKYWEWYDANVDSSGNADVGWNWCANFVRYCVQESGVTGEGHTFPNVSPFTWACIDILNGIKTGVLPGTWYTYNGVWKDSSGNKVDFMPEPGDIILYWDTAGMLQHVNIAYEVESSGSIRTIGGNEGAVSGSSPYWQRSIVRKPDYTSQGALEGYWGSSLVYRPDWKTTQVFVEGEGDGEEYIGSFDIANYPKEDGEYYTSEETEQIIYDFLRIEMGYNSAAATGVMANLYIENKFNYDALEVASGGKVYKSAYSTSTDYINVPAPSDGYGNGNYKRAFPTDEAVENILRNTSYYYMENSDDIYSVGYGLCAWTKGRKVAMLNYSVSNNYGKGWGPDSLAGQLAYLKYELENTYSSVNNEMLSVDDTEEGAIKATWIWANKFEVCAESVKDIRVSAATDVIWPKWKGKAVSIASQQPSQNITIEGRDDIKITSQGGLLDIDANLVDPNYTYIKKELTTEERDYLERLVYGESGNQGFIGMVLIAQALKDTWYMESDENKPYSSMIDLAKKNGYVGSTSKGSSQDSRDAVKFVFDQGGYAIKHRVYVFYAPSGMENGWSAWHETQLFLLHYRDVKFFDRKWDGYIKK